MSSKTHRIIYGVNPDKKVTPVIVRDAIIKCFKEAEKEILEVMRKSTDMKKSSYEKNSQFFIEHFIEERFRKIGADFNRPKKEDLKKVANELKRYALKIRDPKIVNQNHKEIMTLINKIK